MTNHKPTIEDAVRLLQHHGYQVRAPRFREPVSVRERWVLRLLGACLLGGIVIIMMVAPTFVLPVFLIVLVPTLIFNFVLWKPGFPLYW